MDAQRFVMVIGFKAALYERCSRCYIHCNVTHAYKTSHLPSCVSTVLRHNLVVFTWVQACGL